MNKSKIINLALDKFIRKYIKDPNVIGIFVTGSFVHSKLDKNSDIDVYILLKDSKIRKRGNTWINGIEIEYLINPTKQVRVYFKDEFKNRRNTTAHMFANSLILYKKGKELDMLIKEAKNILKKDFPKMSKVAIENSKYFIDDLRKDVEDVYLKNDWFAFNITANQLIDKCLETFYYKNGLSIEKSKRLKSFLKKYDLKFEKLFSAAVLEKNYAKRLKALNNLSVYSEKLLGGKRTREWDLKGGLTC